MPTPETGIIISDAVAMQIKINTDGTVQLFENIEGVWQEVSTVTFNISQLNVTTKLFADGVEGETANFNAQGGKTISKLQVKKGLVTKLETSKELTDTDLEVT
jgi:hypothetical protein